MIQILAAAGGPTRVASMKNIKIMHINLEGVRTEVASIDLRKIIDGKVKDLELIPGDIVVVPSSQLKAYLDLGAKSMAQSSVYILARY